MRDGHTLDTAAPVTLSYHVTSIIVAITGWAGPLQAPPHHPSQRTKIITIRRTQLHAKDQWPPQPSRPLQGGQYYTWRIPCLKCLRPVWNLGLFSEFGIFTIHNEISWGQAPSLNMKFIYVSYVHYTRNFQVILYIILSALDIGSPNDIGKYNSWPARNLIHWVHVPRNWRISSEEQQRLRA